MATILTPLQSLRQLAREARAAAQKAEARIEHLHRGSTKKEVIAAKYEVQSAHRICATMLTQFQDVVHDAKPE